MYAIKPKNKRHTYALIKELVEQFKFPCISLYYDKMDVEIIKQYYNNQDYAHSLDVIIVDTVEEVFYFGVEQLLNPNILIKTIESIRSEYAQINQPIKKTRPLFYMGFEIEGCILTEMKGDFIRALKEIYPNNLSVKRDGSIRPGQGFDAIEIATPALFAPTAIYRLEMLLDFLTNLSEGEVFKTNKTCGFHVNISEKKIFSLDVHKYREDFAHKFANIFDPVKWRKVFKRQRNQYCLWRYGKPKNISDLRNLDNHYSAINTQHIKIGNPKERRIEIRVAGNENYHCHEQISNFILDIQSAMSQAHEAIS